MSDSSHCPACGTSLPAGGHVSFCPCCLLRAGLSHDEPAEPTPELPQASEDDVTAPREAPGALIGRYRLLEEIGEGGFAIVYLAEQTAPVTRKVALKVLKPGMDTREVVARFEAERQALALMDHPNIAQVYDGGVSASGRPYFVMELVKGVPLTRYCDDQRLTIPRRLELFLDVIEAVQHAHQQGIMHRDLKPANILVNPNDGKPVVKVIDFGIAKAIGIDVTGRGTLFTGLGRLLGTPEYMSPEQAELSASGVDTRTDVYALGVVLYELLTGRTPLDSKSLRSAGYAEIQRMIREEEPRKPSACISNLGSSLTEIAALRGTEPLKLGRQVRGDMDWIVMKALEKDRKRRYPSVSGLAGDIQRFLRDETVSARPPGARYRFSKFARRNKTTLAVGILIALILVAKTALAVGTLIAVILVATTAFSSWLAIRKSQAQGEALTSQAEALERLRQACISEARALRLSGQPGRRFKALKSLRTAAEIRPGPDIRDEAVPIWGVADIQAAETWPTIAGSNDLAAIAPDFSCHAVATPDGAVTVLRNGPAGEIVAELPGTAGTLTTRLRFSPDSRLLAVGRTAAQSEISEVVVWDLVRNVRLGVIAGVAGDALDFSPDAALMAVGCGNEVVVVNPQSGEHLRSWACLSGLPHLLQFRPDGKALAVVSLTAAEVAVTDIENGKVLAREPFVKPRAIAWHRDCRRLAVACEGHVTIWDTLDTARKVVIAAAPKATIDRVAWSHATELLASSGPQQPLAIHDANLGETLVHTYACVRDLRFSPDDTRLGLTWDTEQLGLFEVADGRLACHAQGNGDRLLDSAWSSGVLATLSGESLRFWNKEMRDIGSRQVTHGRLVKFTPDGLLLVADSVQRFPYQLTGEPPVLHLGPPEILDPRPGWEFGSTTSDGRWLAVARHDQVTLFDLNISGSRRQLGNHPRLDQAALSPAGDLLATATSHGSGVKVWTVASGQLATEFPAYGPCRISFSHDGTWLAVATDSGYYFHRVGTWMVERTIPRSHRANLGWLVWSPRDYVIALTPGDYSLAIHDAHSFALLASPQFEQQRPLNFSPDGSLLVTTDPNHRIHLWDLAQMRAQLAALGADLSLPQLPQSTAPLVEAVVFAAADTC